MTPKQLSARILDDDLPQYFARCGNEIGRAICAEILDFTAQPITEREYRSLIERIDHLISSSPRQDGSAVMFIWHTLVEFGEDQGYVVPRYFPVHQSPTALKCVRTDGYPALELEKIYEALEVDHAKQQVRVLDERRRQSWYPFSCFASPSPLARPWW